MVAGYIWWALHQVFATKSVMHGCKNEMVDKINEKEAEDKAWQQRFEDKNEKQHSEIWSDVRSIKNFLMGHRHDKDS